MGVFRNLKYISDHPLNRGAQFAALARFARLQFVSRLISQPLVLPYIDGTRLYMQAGMTGVTANWYSGLAEPSEMGFVLHALNADDLFMDIGANVGSYTILAAGAVGARTIAVEPLPKTFAGLRANVRLNELDDRVELHRVGLSAEKGQLLFTTEHDTGNRVAIPGETRATTVIDVTTLDALLQGRSPAIIKIDVEGHEAAVLAGGEATLSSGTVLAVLMETNASSTLYGGNAMDIVNRMHSFGFRPFAYDPFRRELLPFRKGQENTVFLRDESQLLYRCRASKQYELVNGNI